MDVFESILQGLWQARPPGVSGSKIQKLTQIAVQHVKDSGKMAMLLYKHFKKTPGTHKLGVLYVLDSIARAYQDLARGDDTAPEDGTFAGGLQQLTQLLESLMNDMMLYAPEEHREKVRKLVNIWEKAATFPSGLLLRLRSTHFSEASQTTLSGSVESTGNMIDQSESSIGQKSQLIASLNTSMDSCLSSMPTTLAVQVLVQMARKMQMESQMGQQTTSQPIGTSGILSGTIGRTNEAAPISTTFNNLGSLNTVSGMITSLVDHRTASNQNPISSLQSSPDTLQAQQIALLQLLAQQGVSAAQIQSIIQHVQSKPMNEVPVVPSAFNNTQTILGNPPPIFSTLDKTPTYVADVSSIPPHSTNIMQNSTSIQHNAAHSQHVTMSIPHSSGPRDGQGGVLGGMSNGSLTDSQISGMSGSSLRQRDSREPLSRLTRPPEDRGKSKTVPRQRNQRSASPPSTRIHSTVGTSHLTQLGSCDRTSTDCVSSEPSYALPQRSHSPKCYLRDPSIAEDSIKGSYTLVCCIYSHESFRSWLIFFLFITDDCFIVLSRTLFIGGVSQSISQEKLQHMFSYYGDIQSCILNHAARHAFIKMYRRKDAEAARAGMETYVYGDTVIRTKWGVGFGPRDCSNYTTGVSVIPIRRLTEVDRRWCMYAEWGGTGGLPLQGGFVMEEPDIEIGTAINSKTANKRLSQNRNEHKDTVNQKQQRQQLSQSSQLQQNCHPAEQPVSQSPHTLVSPWVGAIQAQTVYKMPQ
ncbi:hypothetical protein PCK1_001613 [Pneumocystis canis]|nr:hypothetical protein PCK1_001613 [Pneumocystis canis]